MLEFTPYRKAVGIVRVCNTPFLEVTRVWMCEVCGAKVIYCKPVACPEFQCCLCGNQKWKKFKTHP